MNQTALKRQRIEAGYATAKDFAAKIGMSYNTYIKYEKGTRNMTLDQAWELADALDCRIDDLVDSMTDDSNDAATMRAADPRAQLIADYDSLCDEDRRALERIASALAQTQCR